MNLQPTLTGSRITLRPLAAEDFEALYAVASDPLVWEQHPESNRYQKDIFQKFFDEAMACKGALAIIDQKTGEIIGSSRYYEYDAEKNEVFIGYTFLARAYWGGQVNREMKKLMLFHAYRFVKKVLFHVGAQNYRSQAAMKKIGGFIIDQRVKTTPSGESQTTLIYQVNLGAGEAL
jgi:RimJ/RimL family protein N-acetyltransferase